jgi:SPP1 gp7 family putative phage head morphogenesis protein
MYRLQAKGKKPVKLKPNRLRIGDENSLKALYMDVVRGWNNQLKTTIIPAYKLSYSELINDDWLSSISNALIAAGSVLSGIAASLRTTLSQWTIIISGLIVSNWTVIVENAIGVDNSTLIDREQISKITEASNLRLQQSLLGFNESMRTRIGEIVWLALQRQTPPTELARQLNEYIKLSTRRAGSISSSQAQFMLSALDSYLQKEAGLTSYVWRHTPQEHPRIHHVRRDFRVFRWDDPPADGPPGTQPNCKCYTQAVVPLSNNSNQGILV